MFEFYKIPRPRLKDQTKGQLTLAGFVLFCIYELRTMNIEIIVGPLKDGRSDPGFL